MAFVLVVGVVEGYSDIILIFTVTFVRSALDPFIFNPIFIGATTTGVRCSAVAISLSFLVTGTLTRTKGAPACPRVIRLC